MRILAMILLSAAGWSQTPPPATANNAKVYLLLKPGAGEGAAARDSFTQRMTALGAVNVQFVTGTNAVRCEAPTTAQTAMAADADVAAVLPMDGTAATSPPQSPNAAPVPAPPPQALPPYIPPPAAPMPFPAAVPVGGGMSMGMTMLTDFAGTLAVKLLAPPPACRIRLRDTLVVLPAAGGAGALEVRASGSCAWQAVSTSDWLRVKSEVNANGTVAITYSAAGNSGGHRQGAIIIQAVAGAPGLKGRTVALVAQQ